MGVTLYTNQFGQSVAVGDLDLGLMASGSITGIVSPNQSSPAATINAGSFVKIDTTITSGYVVNFLQAAQTDLAFGVVKRLLKQGTFGSPYPIEVSLPALPVMWLLANATITPGATVYSDSTGQFVNVTASSNKARGIALDYATNGNVLRVLITPPVAIAS